MHATERGQLIPVDLATALLPFTWHWKTCRAFAATPTSENCSCGLRAAWLALREARPTDDGSGVCR